jgi:hypothetical protein
VCEALNPEGSRIRRIGKGFNEVKRLWIWRVAGEKGEVVNHPTKSRLGNVCLSTSQQTPTEDLGEGKDNDQVGM